MKRFILIAALLMVTAGISFGQVGITNLFTDESYSGTSADTSDTFTLDPFDGFVIAFAFDDSNNVAVYVDYRQGTGAWATYTAIDSTDDATAAGGFASKAVRLYATDNIPGGTSYRVRVAGINDAPDKNSADSGATFDGWAFRRYDK